MIFCSDWITTHDFEHLETINVFHKENQKIDLSLGIIPSIECPTYAELRNRDSSNWYSPEMKKFLNSKLYERN